MLTLIQPLNTFVHFIPTDFKTHELEKMWPWRQGDVKEKEKQTYLVESDKEKLWHGLSSEAAVIQ